MEQDNRKKLIIMTVDIEDWFQVENLRIVCPFAKWDSYELRVENNARRLLDLFDKHQAKATFFVLGWIAERLPELIREIHSRGHEVASHGYIHRVSYELTSRELREDLQRSKSVLEEIIGESVYGYRAPCFSLTRELIELIHDTGYRYDSSLNNASFSTRYGKPTGVLKHLENGMMKAPNGVIEIPISNLKLGRLSLPWGGGGYFRLWPWSLFRWGVKRILSAGKPYVFYFHPWEIDLHQPPVKNLGVLARFRHYLNISDTYSRLERFFSSLIMSSITSCSDHLQSAGLLTRC